jgi:two-component system sensor histidine kinase CiaH
VTDRAPAGRLLALTRRRMAVVTLLLIGALVLAIGAATAFIATRALDQDVDRALDQAAIAESQRLAGELPTAGGDAGDEHAPGASDTFFLILDSSGGLVSNPSGVPRQGLPDGAAVAAARATGRDIRTVQDGAVPIRLLTLPIGDAANPVGWLEAGFVLTLHERQSRSLILAVTLVGLVGLAGAALVTLFVTGRALVPIRAAFATERRFVADASHEIRTPAAIIRASAEVLEREGLVMDEGRPLVADIVAESDRLGGLVDDLLALASSERGSLVIERRPIDLAEIARDTVRRAGPLAAERGIDLVGPAEDGTVLPVVGDTNRLVQLLLVLVDNASRHSPPGGRVTVTTGPPGGRTAAVSVDDQGPGVPAEAREAIFEPFARLPGSRTRADAGSGLGLSIARRLAELHGGTLAATEAPGGGARFVLSLPVGRSGGAGAAGAGPTAAAAGARSPATAADGAPNAGAPSAGARPAKTG